MTIIACARTGDATGLSMRVFTFSNGQQIPFTIRKRKGQKSIRLSVTAHKGVMVSCPAWISMREVEKFMQENEFWISARLEEVRPVIQRRLEQARILPQRVEFISTGHVFEIEYRHTTASGIRATLRSDSEESAASILVTGPLDDAEGVARALKRFALREGRTVLAERAYDLAQHHNLNTLIHEVAVRDTQRRWGSCSVRGRIMLSAQLLFVPQRLLDYVILHELAHLIVPNHSKQFYDYLATLEPNAPQLRAELKQISGHLPWWMCNDSSCVYLEEL